MKYLDYTGLQYFWSKLKALFAAKQDTLVSGTNIKTINGNSILGGGDIQAGEPDAVKYVSQTLTEAQKAQARTNISAVAASAISALETAIAAKYSKPSAGIPETDLASAVQSALALARTSIQSLADYYSKTEVDALLDAVGSEQYVDVTTLPAASASTLGKIYLVGPDANGFYDRYYTSYDGSTYSWVAAGNTEINLANYATKEEVSQLEANVAGNLMSSRAKNALLAVFDKVAFAVHDVSAEMTELENALFNLDEIVGITATFTQGDTVVYDQGVDILSDLRSMLVVKAQYGDGAEFPVSDYVLSGELTTGTSTITVTYQGFTDTFTVVVTHYTAKMVFTMADGDVSKFKGSAGSQTSDNTKLGINAWGTQLNRRVFLANSGTTPIKQLNGTSTGKYPIPVPRNAKKVTVEITPSNLNNVGTAIAKLENNDYDKSAPGFYHGYYDVPYSDIFTDEQIEAIRKGGWFFIATAATKSGNYSSSNEPTGITITFE